MTISSRVQQQFFSPSGSTKADEIIRLPLTLLDQIDYWSFPAKAIATTTSHVDVQRTSPKPEPPHRRINLWTAEEHERFLRGLEMYPRGPWKRVASVVRTKTTRQTMTHAQKYRQKIERHQRLTQPTAVEKPKLSQPRYHAKTASPRLAFLYPTHIAPSATQASAWGLGELTDPELCALLESLEPIDGPDAWFMQPDTVSH